MKFSFLSPWDLFWFFIPPRLWFRSSVSSAVVFSWGGELVSRVFRRLFSRSLLQLGQFLVCVSHSVGGVMVIFGGVAPGFSWVVIVSRMVACSWRACSWRVDFVVLPPVFAGVLLASAGFCVGSFLLALFFSCSCFPGWHL